ncbi:hypothetical protein BT96DRAFT_1007741 [Gymnopus androsaceus JB14]|uniref:GCM domain-containing protein n=1 Tax=Gymnopus androsaceus JB14 TaxID=1447944 RepID=A0A6A4GGN4_9AGAR|nr:hypothetical protein BT96DRAFT_1007741 [Gymnopus androsaceus JB14]
MPSQELSYEAKDHQQLGGLGIELPLGSVLSAGPLASESTNAKRRSLSGLGHGLPSTRRPSLGTVPPSEATVRLVTPSKPDDIGDVSAQVSLATIAPPDVDVTHQRRASVSFNLSNHPRRPLTNKRDLYTIPETTPTTSYMSSYDTDALASPQIFNNFKFRRYQNCFRGNFDIDSLHLQSYHSTKSSDYITLQRKFASYFSASESPPVKPPDTGNEFRTSRSTRASKFIRPLPSHPATSSSDPLNPPEGIGYNYPPAPMPYTYPPPFPYNLPQQTPYPYPYPYPLQQQPQRTISSQKSVIAPNKTQTRIPSAKKGVRFRSHSVSSNSSHAHSKSEPDADPTSPPPLSIHPPAIPIRPAVALDGRKDFVDNNTQYVRFEDLVDGWNQTEELAVHWACKNTGGKQRSGAGVNSFTVVLGKRNQPLQNSAKVTTQLQKPCKCGGIPELYPMQKPCKDYTMGRSVFCYYNGTQDHNHPLLPILHLTPTEKKSVKSLIQSNPKAAPAALVSGNTVDATSAARISPALINPARVGRYRSQILGTGDSKAGDDFIATFMQYQTDNPGWIVSVTMLGTVAVVSAQTPFMQSQLKAEALQVQGPFNGVISDAAHGCSVFNEVMQRWIPALVSYSDGATAAHFELHFLVLMESIARIAQERGKSIEDALFSGKIADTFELKYRATSVGQRPDWERESALQRCIRNTKAFGISKRSLTREKIAKRKARQTRNDGCPKDDSRLLKRKDDDDIHAKQDSEQIHPPISQLPKARDIPSPPPEIKDVHGDGEVWLGIDATPDKPETDDDGKVWLGINLNTHTPPPTPPQKSKSVKALRRNANHSFTAPDPPVVNQISPVQQSQSDDALAGYSSQALADSVPRDFMVDNKSIQALMLVSSKLKQNSPLKLFSGASITIGMILQTYLRVIRVIFSFPLTHSNLTPLSTFKHPDFIKVPANHCHWFSKSLLKQHRQQAIPPIEYERISHPPRKVKTLRQEVEDLSDEEDDSESPNGPKPPSSSSGKSSDLPSLVEHQAPDLIPDDSVSSFTVPPKHESLDSDGFSSVLASLVYSETASTPPAYSSLPLPSSPHHVLYPFWCHECDIAPNLEFHEFRRMLPKIKTQRLETVSSRLFPGKGILVQSNGVYYYPGRLISWDEQSLTGTVQMWRGIENDLANKIIHNIRLGKYLRPLQEKSNKEDAEDKLLLDPNAVKCPADLRSILDMHKQLITSLILDPSQQSVQKVPTLAMMAVKQKLKIDATMYSGGLLDADIAAINNWFHTTFSNATKIIIQGRHAYAIAHCHTLLIAHRHQDEFMAMEHNSSTDNIEQFVLQKAWDCLQQWNGLTVDGKEKGIEVDVNFEAISLLDKIMFDRSERAGHAGNDQWGLDAGPHELCWGPTFSGPDVTEQGQEREGDNDIELQKGADYDQVVEANELERAKALREEISPKNPDQNQHRNQASARLLLLMNWRVLMKMG